MQGWDGEGRRDALLLVIFLIEGEAPPASDSGVKAVLINSTATRGLYRVSHVPVRCFSRANHIVGTHGKQNRELLGLVETE